MSGKWIGLIVIMPMLIGLLTGCGKRGAPEPAGPANQIIYPKIYPTY